MRFIPWKHLSWFHFFFLIVFGGLSLVACGSEFDHDTASTWDESGEGAFLHNETGYYVGAIEDNGILVSIPLATFKLDGDVVPTNTYNARTLPDFILRAQISVTIDSDEDTEMEISAADYVSYEDGAVNFIYQSSDIDLTDYEGDELIILIHYDDNRSTLMTASISSDEVFISNSTDEDEDEGDVVFRSQSGEEDGVGVVQGSDAE